MCGVCARLASWLLCFSCVCYLYIKNVTPSYTLISPCDGFQFDIFIYRKFSTSYPLVNTKLWRGRSCTQRFRSRAWRSGGGAPRPPTPIECELFIYKGV